MNKPPQKKITPKDNAFDSIDHDVPLEVEAYNNGINDDNDAWHKWINEAPIDNNLEGLFEAYSVRKVDRKLFIDKIRKLFKGEI